MKKQNAIIALLLIVSLLISSMTMFVSAEESNGAQSNTTEGGTQTADSEDTLVMSETLVSSKNGKVDAKSRPVYAEDKPDAISPNLLDGELNGLSIGADNEGVGYGIFDVYDIKYGTDEFMRLSLTAAGLEANGGKIKRDVKIGITSGAYGYFNMTGVAGDLDATLGSIDGYFVYDFQFATEYQIPSFNIMPIVRVAKNGTYTMAPQLNLSLDSYAKYMKDGKWAHITIVGDWKNNTMHVFVNGALVGTSKIISKLPDATTDYDTIRVEGIRMSTSAVAGVAGMNLYMDNVAARYYDTEQATKAGLIVALADKNISAFKDHYEDKATTLPPIARIEGLIYNTSADVSNVLSGNTDTPYNVDILRSFPSVISINADSVINTHGFVSLNNFTFPEGTHYEMEDGYLTVDVPFVPNSLSQKPASTLEYTSNSLSKVEGNLASGISTSLNDNILILKNVDDGAQCVEFNFLNAKMDYVNVMAFSSSYKLASYPYGIFAFDLVSFSSNMKGGFYMLGRASGPLSWSSYNFATLLAGIPVGDVAQFTIAYGLKDAATGTYEVRIFRNGEYLTNGSFKTTDAAARFEAVRFQPTGGHFALDNIYSVPSATTVFDADGNLLDEFNQFNKPGYEKLSLPSVAIVDGVVVAAADQVTSILDSHALVYQQNVTINHKFTGTIKVNVSAVIETNGFVGLDSFEFGEGVTYVQEGTKIITKAPLDLSDKVTTSDLDKSGFSFPLTEAAAPDNELVNSISLVGEQTITYLDVNTVTNAYDGSKYYGIITNSDYLVNSDKATPNKYVAINVKKTIKVDTSSGKIADILKTADEEYLVFDIDLSTNNRFFSGFDITNTPRWSSETSSNIGFASTNGLKITSQIGTAPEEWVHITAVYDVRNNVRYIYIDGEYSFTAGFVEIAPVDGSTGIYLQQIRLNIPDGVTLAEDMSLYFDNVSMRSFDASETALIEAITNKTTLTTWDKNHAGKGAEGNLSIVASVDGVAFTSVEEAVKYAFDNKAKQLSIYDEYTGLLEVNHDISIYVMNGKLNYVTTTHAVTEKDGLYTFTKNDSALNTLYVVYDRFTFEDNAGVGGYEVVKFGNGSQFRYENESFVDSTYYNGKYYTFNGKWMYETSEGLKDFTGVVTDDCNFKLLIPQYDTVDAECMFSYKLNGGEITLANSVDELKTLLSGEYTSLEVTLYEDVTLAEGIEVKGALTLNLNGNDLVFTSINSAGFALTADNATLEISSAKAGASIHYTNDTFTDSDYLITVVANGCDVTVNGRNLSVYAGALVTDSTGTGNTVTVTGGTFYRVLSSEYAYVTVKGGTIVNVTAATFVDTLNNGVWFATSADENTVFDGAEINVTRSTVISLEGTALVREAQDKNGQYVPMTFNALTYLSNGGKLSYDESVSDAVNVGKDSYTNVELSSAVLADGLKLLYQYRDHSLKLYYPAYVNGTADYTLTESQYAATTTYKVGSPYAIAVNGMKYNLTLYSHFNINLYIPVSETNKFVAGTFEGVATKLIDGVEYYVFTESVNANAIGEDVSFEFALVNNEAYIVTLNIVDYAENILAKTSVSDSSYTAQLMVAMLEYASSVYAFEGKDNSALIAIVSTYESYKVTTEEFGEAVDTAPLAQFLSSASMYLHESPSFIFKLKSGFTGTVKVECGHISRTYNSADGDTVTLAGLRITDIQETITLTFTPEGGESVVCTYNLATYYQGVAGNDAAAILLNALRNYSNVAKEYMARLGN